MTKSTRKVGRNKRKGGVAIDGVAARVLGVGRKGPAEERLMAKANSTKDGVKKAKVLQEADRAMRISAKRMVSPAAEARAKRALERARWEHDK